jgi:hypothetical protein
MGNRDESRGIEGLVLPSPYLDVEIGRDRQVWVNNPGRHRVEVYSPEGELCRVWGKASMALPGFCGCCNPVNLALTPEGQCVTFEKGLPRVKVYAADGELATVVAGPELFEDSARAAAITDADESAYGGLDGVVDSKGRVYVLDLMGQRIRVFRRKSGGNSS